MSEHKPAVAVIGCGGWGRNHLRVWDRLGCLRAACDLDPGRLEEVSRQYPDVRLLSDPEKVFADPEIEAAVVASPAPTHYEIARQALQQGKHVLVEKPLAIRLEDGRELVDTARRMGKLLMVGHVLEFHPAVAKLQQLVSSGDLGRIQYLSSNRLNIGKIRTEENALWSFAPHDIALILRLLGRLPERVSCQGGAYLDHHVADVTLTGLTFSSGVRGHIFVSWLHPFKEQRFVVVGTRQMAVFDDTADWSGKLVLYSHQVDWVDGQVPVARRAEGTPIELTETEPLLAECSHFLDCIRSGQTPLTDGKSALRVLQVLATAQKSLESGGQPIDLAEPGEEKPYFAHPTAVVDKGARIGRNTRIWHYSHVMGSAVLGSSCVLGQNVFVGPEVRIGDQVKIQNNVSVYQGVELEDDVFCGPSMVFTNVVNPRSAIERKSEFLPTLVKKGATLGANCTILCGHTIGEYAFVAAGAVVTKDVEDFALVRGVPAQRVGWMCRCGIKLSFNEGERAQCTACGTSYQKKAGAVSIAEQVKA